MLKTSPMDHNTFLREEDYNRFQKLILKRTGMLFGNRRRNALAQGVVNLAGQLSQGDLGTLYDLLQQSATEGELWDQLIKSLTIGETYFFRDKSQIQVLQEHILPQIIAGHQHDRRIRIWSAGCSTGEEPYTLAILLSELLFGLKDWTVFILGTDINKESLHKARAGLFRPWSFRQTEEQVQSRYFRRKGEAFELVPWIRNRVHLAYLNLNETLYPSLTTNTNALDLILCRNVAIYYSEVVVQNVVERFHRCLVPGGWLMMGAAETGIPAFERFATRNFRGGSVFQKTTEPSSPSIAFDIRPTDLAVKHVTSGKLRRPASSRHNKRLSERPFLKPKSSREKPSQEGRSGLVSGSTECPTLFARSLRLIREKRYEEAIEGLQACLASDPENAEAKYHLARVHANIGQMEAARSWCEQALEMNPLLTPAYYTLGLIHQECGQVEAAIEKYKRAIFLDSAFVLAHFSLAMLYSQLDAKEKSNRHRRQALKVAAGLEPNTVLPGSDDITAAMMQSMVKAVE